MKQMLVILLLCHFFIPLAFAQEMTSPSYKLQLEQIETTTSEKIHTLSDKQMKEFLEEGYIVTDTKKDSLQFSISDTVLNYNTSQKNDQNSVLLSAAQLKTSPGASYEFGYRMISELLKPFERSNGDSIPLEYNIAGPDSIVEFQDKTFFRTLEVNEFSLVAGNDWTKGKRSSRINIQTKTSTQSTGGYNALLKLILLPSL